MTTLEQQHIESALDKISDPSRIALRHRAKKYCLIVRDKHWSPKYVVGLAWKYATGTMKSYTKFSGGERGANLELQRLGYTVESCNAAHYQALSGFVKGMIANSVCFLFALWYLALRDEFALDIALCSKLRRRVCVLIANDRHTSFRGAL